MSAARERGEQDNAFSAADALELRRFAEALAQETAAELLSWYGKDLAIQYKSDTDLVTSADRAAEDLIVTNIRNRFPDHRILAEESAPIGGPGRIRWVVDPLDGTTNFAHNLPIFSVSIAAEAEGEILAGAVVLPVIKEAFSAHRGGGATLNGQPIHVSATSLLKRSLLATGFPYDLATDPDNNLDHFVNLRPLIQGVRRCGAASWDLCCTACGRFDGYWEAKLKPWDMAAGSLIVTEAGGRISGFRGQRVTMFDRQLVASNRLIHQQIIDALAFGKTMMNPPDPSAMQS